MALDARPAGQDRADPRGGLLLPPRPPPGADAAQDRRPQGRLDDRACTSRALLDGGAYGTYGVASTYYTGALQTVTYELPSYRFDGVRCFTNKPPCGPKRGHGTPQPRFALEVQLDKVAERLGLDPAELRLRNLASPDADHRQLAAARLDRPRRAASRRWSRASDWKPAARQAAARPRPRPGLRRLPVRRRPADLLEQHAAVRRAAPARPLAAA